MTQRTFNEPLKLFIEAITPERNEGDRGTIAFWFEVTREGGDLTQPLTVDCRVQGSNPDPATVGEGGDILEGTGQVRFVSNASTAVIKVDVVGDTVEEPDEGFQVELFDPGRPRQYRRHGDRHHRQ